MIKWWFQDSSYKSQFQVSFPSFALLLFKIKCITTGMHRVSAAPTFSYFCLCRVQHFYLSFSLYTTDSTTAFKYIKHWVRVLYVFMLTVYTDSFFLQLISLCFTDPSSSPSIPQAAHFTISLSMQFHLWPHQFLHWN